MKNKKIILVAILLQIATMTNAQFLKNLTQKAMQMGLNEGVNAIMKNTSINLGGSTFTFGSSVEKLYGGSIWHVNQNNNEFIKVYKDVKLQSTAGQLFRGNDYSFDLFILNDTTLFISHIISRKPYNSEYVNGNKYDLFIIKDSTIYLKEIENSDSLTAIVKNKFKGKGFIPFAKFTMGKIYDLSSIAKTNNEPIGTYKYFNPGKANFIFTSIYYKLTYGQIDEKLFNEKLQSLHNYAQDWNAKEKECSHCSKKFTGSAVKINSKHNCSTVYETTGLWVSKSIPLFCTIKCAEKYCIELK
jgi:hypothetical protein